MAQPWWQENYSNGFGSFSGRSPEAKNPQVLATLYAQPANFAGALAGNYGNYSQGLGSLGQSYANAYGAYNAGLASMMNARANESSARYGANAMAEAARQASLGTLGASALGAYGGAANSALGAWASNQAAYNNALSQMHQADQMSASQLGQSANAANASVARARIGANALAGLNLGGGGGGGGFAATGPGGGIASGSYSAPAAGGGGSFSGGGFGGGRFGGGGSDGGSEGRGALSGLRSNAAQAAQRLDSQHMSSRTMPSDLLGQTLTGLQGLMGGAAKHIGAGMDQYYENARFNEAPYQQMADQMSRGYDTAGGQLGGVQRDLGGGFQAANTGIRGLWDSTLGNLPMFQSPAQRLQNARDAQNLQRRFDAQDAEMARMQAADEVRAYQNMYGPAVAAQYYGRDPNQYIRELNAAGASARGRQAFIPT